MANSNTTQAIETLAAEIGENIYIDVAKWHLYLREAHLHTTVAEQIYPLIENNELNEDGVLSILRKIQVSLGGGRIKVSLLELLPMQCQIDLIELLEEYQRNR
ncbi:MAG TPA: thylakoid-associated protein [Cyanothece sp. UBA12306]|nr:thylakoid-associated protein [Cyanothece sp. UBA12306]